MDERGQIGGKCQNDSFLDIDKTNRIWMCKFNSIAFPEMWFKFKWDSIKKKILARKDKHIMQRILPNPTEWHPMVSYYIVPGKLNFHGPSNLRLRFINFDTLRIDDKLCPETRLEFSVPK